MERILRVATAVLLFAFVVLYIAAKVHFFTRFGATNLDGYIAGHWPYSAGLTAIAALAWVIVWLSGKIGVETPKKGSPTTNEPDKVRAGPEPRPLQVISYVSRHTMIELTDREKAYCAAIADRIKRLRRLLADGDLCDPPDARRWYTFLAELKSIQGNVNNDLGFVATLLAKAWLAQRFPISAFDAAAKAQGAGGLDVDLKTTDGSRIVAEIKNTVPYGAADFGAAQKREFEKDFAKLNAAVADHKFLFVTDPRAFALLERKYAQQIPGVKLVLLEAGHAS